MIELIRKNLFAIKRYARQLADLHAELHGKPVSGLSGIKESISSDIRSVQSLDEAKREAILNYLDTLPDGDRLCHYDFHPGNVLIQNGKARVIDWMTAGMGDPCADVCRTAVILGSDILPPDRTFFHGVLIQMLRKRLYNGYIKRYLKITGKTQEQVNAWLGPVAAARLAEGISRL
jgi:aminoglycoside phosphotransferase (APT) family kinase protein